MTILGALVKTGRIPDTNYNGFRPSWDPKPWKVPKSIFSDPHGPHLKIDPDTPQSAPGSPQTPTVAQIPTDPNGAPKYFLYTLSYLHTKMHGRHTGTRGGEVGSGPPAAGEGGPRSARSLLAWRSWTEDTL